MPEWCGFSHKHVIHEIRLQNIGIKLVIGNQLPYLTAYYI